MSGRRYRIFCSGLQSNNTLDNHDGYVCGHSAGKTEKKRYGISL
jgi:hypothetical protein